MIVSLPLKHPPRQSSCPHVVWSKNAIQKLYVHTLPHWCMSTATIVYDTLPPRILFCAWSCRQHKFYKNNAIYWHLLLRSWYWHDQSRPKLGETEATFANRTMVAMTPNLPYHLPICILKICVIFYLVVVCFVLAVTSGKMKRGPWFVTKHTIPRYSHPNVGLRGTWYEEKW